jgi:hypothetical protein
LTILSCRIVAPERQQVVRIGAAPGVDALVVVAHAGELPGIAGERLQQAVLRVVGVLAFVDQQVADALAPAAHRVGIGFQQLHRQRIRSSKSTALNAARRCW